MTAINNDAANDTSIEADFDGEGAFAKLWGVDAETPSKTKAVKDDEDKKRPQEDDEGSEDHDETESDDGDEQSTDETEGDDEGDESEGDEGNDANVVVKDDYKVKIKIGDEEKEFTVGSLKRLAGQEASLTQKSQRVSEDRKKLDGQAAAHVAVLDRLLKKANDRFEPFKNLNLLAAAKDPNISAEELTALQQAATAAHEDVRFLTQEMGSFQQALQKQRSDELRNQAAETVKVLSDPEKGIPGWSAKTYDNMMSFAKSEGVPEDALNEIVDPTSLRILHMAMLYKRGVAKVKEETDPKTTTKKKSAPKRIVKSISNSDSNKEVLKGSKSDREKTAMRRLRETGSSDASEAAFLARFTREED